MDESQPFHHPNALKNKPLGAPLPELCNEATIHKSNCGPERSAFIDALKTGMYLNRRLDLL